MYLLTAYMILLGVASLPRKVDRPYVALMLFLLFPVFLVGLFRDGIGTDWDSYKAIYEATADGFYMYEPGWTMLNIIANYFGSFHYVIGIGYLIFLCGTFAIALRYRSAVFLFIMFALFRLGIYFTRIEIACFLFLLSLFAYDTKKLRKWTFLLASLTFHWSMLVPVCIYTGWKFHLKGRRCLVILLVAMTIIVLWFSSQAINSVNNHMFETEAAYKMGFSRLLAKSGTLALLLVLSPRRFKEAPHVYLAGWTLLIIAFVGAIFSPGVERFFVFVYPVVTYTLTQSWSEMSILKRILAIVTLSAIYLSWLGSPFNELYFPIKTILPI
jgi:hypothetical protein